MNFKKLLVTQDSCHISREQMQFFIDNRVEIIKCERNGKRLLKAILEQKPEFVVLDMVMYELDGFEVIAKTKASAIKPLPMFIMSTGVQIQRLEQKAISFGASACLIKPVDITQLTNMILQNVKA